MVTLSKINIETVIEEQEQIKKPSNKLKKLLVIIYKFILKPIYFIFLFVTKRALKLIPRALFFPFGTIIVFFELYFYYFLIRFQIPMIFEYFNLI